MSDAPPVDLHSCYAQRRVAVLGASGFIGRWLARALSQYGAKVGLFVRDAIRMRRIADAWGIEGEVFVADFLRDRRALPLLRAFQPSLVLNAIGYGVDHRERDNSLCYDVNARLVRDLVTALSDGLDASWPGAHFIQLGSALEYGQVGGDLVERMTTPLPNTPYGKAKLAGTRAVAEACDQRAGFRALTARLFMVYGPGEPKGRLFPQLIKTAESGAPIPLSSGDQRKDFTYVADVAEGCLRLAVSAFTPGEAVNVATGQLTSVRQFVQQAACQLRISDDRLDFGAREIRQGEMRHEAVRVDRLRRLTGWQPSTSVAEGIRQTLAFLEASRRSAAAERVE